MITTIVQFKLPGPITLEEARARFQETAPKYQGLAGLVRKYYLFDPDGIAGGVYLWESREAAEGFYDAAWRQFVTDKYGSPPEIRYFETPVIVDNPRGEITVEDAA